MQFPRPNGGHDIANEITPQAVARSTRSAFARGPLASMLSVTSQAGAVSSPLSLTIGDASSHQESDSPSVESASPIVDMERKRAVPHVYRDFTNVPDSGGYIRRKTGGVTQPFPDKLHEMLAHVQEPDVVAWLPHGRAFIVRKPKEFTNRIMPRFFRQTKLTSFQRQLNLYGFRRLTQGPDAGAYYHELFLRGRPQLSQRMQRQKIKGTGHKQPADAMTEPNFYAMPACLHSETHQDREESSDAQFASVASMQAIDPRNAESYDEMSPGMRNLHGAANLLKNIAAGIPVSSMKGTPLTLAESDLSVPVLVKGGLGKISEASIDSSQNHSTPIYSPQDGKPMARISFLSTGDGSMSLLGRVNMEQSPSLHSQRVSTVWPPIKAPVENVAISNSEVSSRTYATSSQFQASPRMTVPSHHVSPYLTLPSGCPKDGSGPMELKVSHNLSASETEEV